MSVKELTHRKRELFDYVRQNEIPGEQNGQKSGEKSVRQKFPGSVMWLESYLSICSL